MKNLNVENLSETLMPIINEKVNLNNKMLNFFLKMFFDNTKTKKSSNVEKLYY